MKSKSKIIITLIAICVVLVLAVIGIQKGVFHSAEMERQDDIPGNTHETKPNSQTVVYQEKVVIPQSQIHSMQEEVDAQYMTVSGEVDGSYRINVSDCCYSRTLDTGFKFKDAFKDRYGQEVFSDDGSGTIQKDYYYLYVDFIVTNIGNDTNLLTHMLDFVSINADGTAQYDMNLDSYNILLLDYDNKFKNQSTNIKSGETVKFKLVYLVPEHMIEEDNIHILLNGNGETGASYLSGENKRFVKLELAERQQ